MKSISLLKRELLFWKKVRRNKLKQLRMEANLPPNLQDEEKIGGYYWQLDSIEFSIWKVKVKLEKFT